MPRRLLTKKRESWVGNRDVTLKGEPLRYNVAAQNRYAKRLDKLTRQMTEEMSKELRSLFKSSEAKQYYAQDASISSMARIIMNKVAKKYTDLFRSLSKPWAERMVDDMAKQSKSSLHSSLEKLSGGLSIKTDLISGEIADIMKASVSENVDLIRSIPEEYLKNVKGAVMRSIAQPESGGISSLQAQIHKMLDNRNRQVLNRAKNIALDQTRKAYNNINAGRMRSVGVEKFIWRHSGGGQNPRSLHRDKLNGNIYSLNDLPVIDERTGERGIPSQLPNCKCVMEPIIEFDNGEAV